MASEPLVTHYYLGADAFSYGELAFSVLNPGDGYTYSWPYRSITYLMRVQGGPYHYVELTIGPQKSFVFDFVSKDGADAVFIELAERTFPMPSGAVKMEPWTNPFLTE